MLGREGSEESVATPGVVSYRCECLDLFRNIRASTNEEQPRIGSRTIEFSKPAVRTKRPVARL